MKQEIKAESKTSDYDYLNKDQPQPITEEMTTSFLPGTTLDFVKVRNSGLELWVHDTPGVPNPKQLYQHFSNLNDVKAVVNTGVFNPQVVMLENQTTLFLGGVARIDHV